MVSKAERKRWREEMEWYEVLRRYRDEWTKKLLTDLLARQEELKALLEEYNSHWGYEDPIYRYYHHSFKVYWLQAKTTKIKEVLESLCPHDRGLSPTFLNICAEGTGKVFEMDHNKEWDKHTRPIVEAFFHAKYFLEMACRYADTFNPEKPPQMLPSGYATLLYLFRMR